jgi:predicted transcriptional regulator
MPTITELAAKIVSAHVSSTEMTKDELFAELTELHAALSALDKGETLPTTEVISEETPAISKKKAFGKKQITCMICGKGFITLKRHLKTAHEMTAKDYCTKFDLPTNTTLAARDYSESRRQMALDKDLAGGLAKARAAKAEQK